jgi:hypothetical protein
VVSVKLHHQGLDEEEEAPAEPPADADADAEPQVSKKPTHSPYTQLTPPLRN